MTEKMLECVDLSIGGRQLSLHGRPGEYIFEQVRSTQDFYESDLLSALGSISLDDQGWIVDGGANIGNHTLFFAANFDLKVMAVEPEQQNLQILRANCRKNRLEDRVVIHDVALWDRDAGLKIANPHPDNSGQARVVTGAGQQVRGVPLDTLCEGLDIVLIKLDLEGSELRALDGARQTLNRCHPVLCVEAHGHVAIRELEQALAPLGYELVHIGGRSDNLVFVHQNSPMSTGLTQLTRRLDIQRHRRAERLSTGSQHSVSQALHELKRQVDTANSEHVTSTQKSLSELTNSVAGLRKQLADKNDEAQSLSEALGSAQEDLHRSESDRKRLLEEIQVQTERSDAAVRSLDELRLSANQMAEREARRHQDLDVLAMSYQLVSDRLESVAPGSWDHTVGVDTAFALLSGDEPPTLLSREVPNAGMHPIQYTRQRKDRVRIGIATMPGREQGLRIVLQSLAPQADEIFVYLNEMDAVPSSLPAFDNVFFYSGPDHGDRGKFLFVDEYEGYYLTCDDDIAYPDFYVDHIIDGIERYGREAIVGWHGSIFREHFSDYYDAKSRQVLAYYSTRASDTGVHLLGTGACGFHTDTMQVSSDIFEIPNMADVWMALQAQATRTPMIVLAHERGWADPIDRKAPSISNASIKKEGGKRLDVRDTVTRTVAAHTPWVLHHASPLIVRQPLNVAIVGRTDHKRWRKGGILKSTHLMANALRRFGVHCSLADIETGDPFELEGFIPQIVVIYAGDPDRPDYARAEAIAKHHMAAGRHVLINMSLQAAPQRTKSIVRSMLDLDGQYPGRAKLMVFTVAAKSMAGFEPIRHLIMEIPKTLAPVDPPYAEFSTSSGVFIGDIAKLSDPALIGGSGKEWVESIRAALPGVPIYGVEQYRPRFEPDFTLDAVWPFLHGEFSERLSTVRIMVAPTKFATFEMVPMELAALGVPVVYREMPQSLSETLGLAGIEIDSPQQLQSVLPAIYNDPIVWRTFSHAGRTRAESQEVQLASGQIYLKMLSLVSRKEERQ